MRIIGLGLLHRFCADHADCRKWIDNWISDAKASTWRTSHDIKQRYQSASFLPEQTVIFNVRGNEYRLETRVAYGMGTVAILWIGTHAEYTRRHR
jgi:mRNA interferase HigB